MCAVPRLAALPTPIRITKRTARRFIADWPNDSAVQRRRGAPAAASGLDAAQVLAEPRVEIKGVCPGGTDPQGGTRDQGDHNVEQSVVNREYPPPCVRQSPLIRMLHEGHYRKGRGGSAARARAN